MTDTLVRRAREGDSDAFEQLLRECDARMRAVAFRMLGNREAMDDALQDAYVRAFRAIPKFRGDAQFSTWLHRIVTTTCIDHLRRSGRRREVELPDDRYDEAPHELATPRGRNHDPASSATRRIDVNRALDRLPADHRIVLLLVDAEGYSYEEAAEVLGVAAGTVSSRLTRARTAMRKLLEDR